MFFHTYNTFLEIPLKQKFGKCTREQRKHFSHCPSPHFNNNFLEEWKLKKFSATSERGASPRVMQGSNCTCRKREDHWQVLVGHQTGQLRGMSQSACPAVQTEVGIIAVPYALYLWWRPERSEVLGEIGIRALSSRFSCVPKTVYLKGTAGVSWKMAKHELRV